MPSYMSVCVSDVAVLRLNRFANQALFFTQNNRDNGCNVLDRDDHGGRRASLNQVGAPRGHNFGVGEQVMRGPKPDSRDGVFGERAASPSPSAVSSPADPAGGAYSPGRRRVFLQRATRLPLLVPGLLFYTCKLQLCVQLFMPIRLQHIFVILLYRLIHLGALAVLWGTATWGPRADAPAGKDTPENCLKAANGY